MIYVWILWLIRGHPKLILSLWVFQLFCSNFDISGSQGKPSLMFSFSRWASGGTTALIGYYLLLTCTSGTLKASGQHPPRGPPDFKENTCNPSLHHYFGLTSKAYLTQSLSLCLCLSLSLSFSLSRYFPPPLSTLTLKTMPSYTDSHNLSS